MARFFSQSQIDEFKECFFFHTRRGHITGEADLSIIMRSLSYSPTKDETAHYFKKYASDKQMDFASFLDAMHEHTEKENMRQELQAAFKAHDRERRGTVPAMELRSILCSLGERLSQREVEVLFKEARIEGTGMIRYDDFLNSILTPVPDY